MVKDLFKKDFIFLDGAMGTMLQAGGLKLGERPEILSITERDTICSIHRQYIEAGSDIIYTNTFGANRHKLEGTGYSVSEIITAAVENGRKACEGTGAYVALDIGPIGELLEPLGPMEFDEAYSVFKEMVQAGERAGADLIVFETMTDLYELKAGVLAAKENTDLPVFATMTFEEGGRTFTGCTVESMAAVMEGLGVDALGINCSLGPDEIFPMADKLCRLTDIPVIVKANAGLPDPVDNSYDITAELFAEQMEKFAASGVRVIGGCCGTTPEYIRNLKSVFSKLKPGNIPAKRGSVLCSPSMVVNIDGVRVIGERINPTGKKRFQQALKECDMEYIAERGVEQAEAGAVILDVNVGMPGIDEKEMMIKAVKTLQSVLPLPLQIDSSDPAAIEAGLRYCSGKAIVNSVNGEDEVMERILPIVKKYGASVVGLCMDSNGIPKTARERVEIAERILNKALSFGIKKEDIFIDCLTLTVSAQQEQARETLNAVRRIKEELGLHCVLGVSNISFGLPNRELITCGFLMQAMENGLDLPIINPNQKAVMDTVAAFKVLNGEDIGSEQFIERFSQPVGETPEIKDAGTKPAMDIYYAVSKGLKEETAKITEEMLKTKSEMEIINGYLIPALDKVGERYEKQEIFLPQLINSANASCEAFEVLKKSILSKGSETVSKGKIILATVKGDIHDIGKNIVKVILENYGYQVIDLGRDVAAEKVVEAAVSENVRLIGLSALMTTTLKSMEETIAALRKSGHECKIVVGGAVLTAEYAKQIGADFYAKDAKQTVDAAKQVIG
ncbi:homocysteine S-methyltransferase family protein [Anaerotignum faecicola]|nr:homocysteine S-methyltransferase family protein [Anaerotignum faecicola]